MKSTNKALFFKYNRNRKTARKSVRSKDEKAITGMFKKDKTRIRELKALFVLVFTTKELRGGSSCKFFFKWGTLKKLLQTNISLEGILEQNGKMNSKNLSSIHPLSRKN